MNTRFKAQIASLPALGALFFALAACSSGDGGASSTISAADLLALQLPPALNVKVGEPVLLDIVNRGRGPIVACEETASQLPKDLSVQIASSSGQAFANACRVSGVLREGLLGSGVSGSSNVRRSYGITVTARRGSGDSAISATQTGIIILHQTSDQ